MPQARLAQHRIFSRREIEGLIADGRKIIILDNEVVKADVWLPFHPGGDKAIQHMVGRDATDEIRALHSQEAQAHMKKFVIGRIDERWENFVPPIQGGVFRKNIDLADSAQEQIWDESCNSSSGTAPPSPIFEPAERPDIRRRRQDDASSVSSISSLPGLEHAEKSPRQQYTNVSDNPFNYPPLDQTSQESVIAKYRELDARLRNEGLYDCSYASYALECVRYTLLFTLSVTCLHFSHYSLSGLFLGLFWHQLTFTAHDAGHMGITHNFHVDTCIGIFVADFLGGLSIGWWKRNHNVHHIVTNSPEHDPDIEHMPFFAISTKFFNSLRSTYYDRVMTFDAVARWAVTKQHWLYYPLLTFGRFNLYRLSWEYLILGLGPRKGPAWWHRYLEIAGNIFFWYCFGYQIVYKSIPTASARLTFVLISHMVTAPLHVQITLSHFAMSTADLGVQESFPQKMLRTTMDVDCPTWLDFVHGGLQFQAVHHLFPRIPRHNLRRAQKYVREFCEEVNIPYVIYGFTQGNREVLGRLEEVAKQAKIFGQCQETAARHLVEGHNH